MDNTIRDTGSIIILTEAWSTVDNARTGVIGDEVGAEDLEAAIVGALLEKVEERLVSFAN